MRYAVSSLVLSLYLMGCGSSNTNDLNHHKKDNKSIDFDSQVIGWKFDNNEGLKIADDKDYIYFQFEHSKNKNFENVQFIIDADNDKNSGNFVEDGADYIVENGYLYKSLSKYDWNWEEIAKVESCIDNDNYVDTIRVKKKLFTNLNNSSFRVSAELLDDKWKPVVYSPSTIGENGIHKKTVYTF